MKLIQGQKEQKVRNLMQRNMIYVLNMSREQFKFQLHLHKRNFTWIKIQNVILFQIKQFLPVCATEEKIKQVGIEWSSIYRQ